MFFYRFGAWRGAGDRLRRDGDGDEPDDDEELDDELDDDDELKIKMLRYNIFEQKNTK